MAWSGEITPELIGDVVKVLIKIPDYIRKIDRKRIAAEKSLQARKNKVQYLEDEVIRFVTKSLHPLNTIMLKLLNGFSPDWKKDKKNWSLLSRVNINESIHGGFHQMPSSFFPSFFESTVGILILWQTGDYCKLFLIFAMFFLSSVFFSML